MREEEQARVLAEMTKNRVRRQINRALVQNKIARAF
jgi:hypothetical protein